MPLCGWCGRQTSEAREYQNGRSIMRLCCDCAREGIGQMSAELLHQSPPPPDDAIPGIPGWIKATAFLLLLIFLVPALLVLASWIQPVHHSL